MKLTDITHRDDFGKYLQEHYPSGIGIELGVALGEFLRVTLTNWTGGRMYGVDCWEEQSQDVYNDPLNNQQILNNMYWNTVNILKPFEDRVLLYKKYTQDIINEFPDKYFDYIYIDANHSYEASKLDIETYHSKIKDGGFFSGHDYSDDPRFGVKQAVNELFGPDKVQVYSCSSWVLKEGMI